MFEILINDYVNKKQSTLGDRSPYYIRAIDLCEQAAFDSIAEKEGVKYFEKKDIYFKSKFDIRKGYAMVLKKSSFSTKITIFHKIQNGLILSGELKKIVQFSTVRIPNARPILLEEDEFFEDQRPSRELICKMIKSTVKPVENVPAIIENPITTPIIEN